jgi:hypothetical protein
MADEVWTFERLAAIADDDVASLDAATRWAHAQLARASALAVAAAHRAQAMGAVAAAGQTCLRDWLRGVTGCASATASRLASLSDALAHLPQASAAFRSGELSTDNAEVLARLHRNRRIRDAVEAHEALLLPHAIALPHPDWCRVAERFRAFVDPDGAAGAHDDAHRRRRVHAGHVGTEFFFHASGDNADGAEIMAIFQRFVQAEFDRDCAAVGRGQKLPRSAAQRRFDAFHEMCRAAACSGEVQLPASLVNFVIDEHTYLDAVARAQGLPVPARPADRFAASRCETIDGVAVDPRHVVYESIAGHVRRVVMNGRGLVTDLGRRRRLFRGAGRDAAMLQSPHCSWPGCCVPASLCDIDHRQPWAALGGTDAANAQPLCPRHNRHKGPAPPAAA